MRSGQRALHSQNPGRSRHFEQPVGDGQLAQTQEEVGACFGRSNALDGANQFQMFFRITLPLLWDVPTVAVVLWSITALNIFEFPFAFTQIEPAKETTTVAVYLYALAFGNRTPIYRFGKASAVGVYLLLSVIVVVIIIRRLMRRESVQY